MKLNAKAVKEKLQNEKHCVMYVYLSGGNFAYDTELKEGCIGKISSLSVEEKPFPLNVQTVPEISIADMNKAINFSEYDVVKKMVVYALLDLNDDMDEEMIAPSAILKDDLRMDYLDIADLVYRLEREMGISISSIAIDVHFDRSNITVAYICQYLHQQITKALEKAEQ